MGPHMGAALSKRLSLEAQLREESFCLPCLLVNVWEIILQCLLDFLCSQAMSANKVAVLPCKKDPYARTDIRNLGSR